MGFSVACLFACAEEHRSRTGPRLRISCNGAVQVMPQWRAVAFTKKPYALYIPETSEVKELAKDQHVR